MFDFIGCISTGQMGVVISTSTKANTSAASRARICS